MGVRMEKFPFQLPSSTESAEIKLPTLLARWAASFIGIYKWKRKSLTEALPQQQRGFGDVAFRRGSGLDGEKGHQSSPGSSRYEPGSCLNLTQVKLPFLGVQAVLVGLRAGFTSSRGALWRHRPAGCRLFSTSCPASGSEPQPPGLSSSRASFPRG